MGAPDRPDWLDEDARAAWDQIVPQLEHMRVLAKIDENALGRYCRPWSRWRRAEAFIEKHGEAYPLKDEQGNLKYLVQSPQVAIAARLAGRLCTGRRSRAAALGACTSM